MQVDAPRATSLVKAARELPIPGASHDDIETLLAGLKKTDLSGAAGLKPLRVSILGNITTDYLADYLRLMLIRAGFDPRVQPGHYGGLVRGLLGEQDLTAAGTDAAVLMLSHRDVQFPPTIGMSAQEARDRVKREVDFWAPLLERSKVPTAVLTFDFPPRRILDEQDGLAPGGLGWHVRMANLELAARLPPGIALVDAESLQYRVGPGHWHDERLYNLCKQPFTMEALPEIAHTLAAALGGLLGRARKVLVLDLDNTLWGGVVGDDGLKGIELGPETADGEAFVAFQTYAKNLSARGIILAVCSKNRDEVARTPFREHSAMVLKESDISCFVANFNDKAANLRQIAKTLNLGLDSLVFADDNPVERALIRTELPEVLTVEMPEDPAYYARAVEASKAFPLRALTSEDLGRVASYRAMAAVSEAQHSGTDMERFLIGLEPSAHIEKVDAASVDRIVQLIRKTNQFKLNLSVFQEAEILASAGRDVIALKLADRLQDYGIVAIAVTRASENVLHIQNWVMSCRVFGRRLENVMLEILLDEARDRGCTLLQADYTATEKNVILPEILERLGFTVEPDGATYRRSVDGAFVEQHHMKIVNKR